MTSLRSISPIPKLAWWLLLAPAMSLPLLASIFYFVLYPGTTFGNSLYSATKVFLLIWPVSAVLLLKLFYATPTNTSPGIARQPLSSILAGVLFGLAVSGLLLLLIKATPLSALMAENAPHIAQRIHDLGIAKHYWVFTVFISTAHAALEEYYWRWFVFGKLRHVVKLPLAYWLSSMAFAAHHIVVMSQFFPLPWAFILGASVGMGGFVWSYTYHRYRSLWGAWISHMIIDFALMWVGWEALQQHPLP